ncbi:uncharacterized protein LOC111635050 [Centruroides sculpturatus]|uniref:uncharacterized protein LOC111635050 n=1 Tax=Centruroides sculpturatus TaxID=218467 RepID=UPI000C6CA8A2|nr:uncharacterized protein LOC111635050 [Centruroides sculpturatus]
MDVICSKSFMTVRMIFSSPFNGLIYSRGKFDEKNCMYVNPNSAITSTSFDIYYDLCGTVNDINGRYYENTIIIQHGPDILGPNDQTKRIRCEWHDVYQTSITEPGVRVSDPEPVVMNFHGDNIDCWMEILEGKSPWSRKLNGIVTLGSPMTLVVAMRDKSNQFDMRVKTCYAHDGHKKPIYLTDEFGCVQRTSLMSQFKKVKDVTGRATVMCYSHFNAFKFPDSIDVYMQCTVEICRFGCPNSCGDEDDDDFPNYEDLREPPKTHNLRDHKINNFDIKIRDILEKKLRDIYVQRLKRLKDKRLRDLRNKRLKDLRDKTKNHDIKFKDLDEDLLKGLRNYDWKTSQESQTTNDESLKQIHESRLKDLQEQILNELTRNEINAFILHQNGDENRENQNNAWNDNGGDIPFRDEESNVKPLTFLTPSSSEKSTNLPVKLQSRIQPDNRTVKEIEVFGSISVPTRDDSELNNGDVITGVKSRPTLSPELTSFSTEQISSDLQMNRQAISRNHETSEPLTSDAYVQSESRPTSRHVIPVSPEFARWLRTANGNGRGGSLFKRTPRVKLSLVSKTGRILMRKYFYPISPMPVFPPPPPLTTTRNKRGRKVRFRTKRSTDEIGISRNFKVVSPEDLAFDPSTIKRDIYEGRIITKSYSFCFTTPGVIGVLCFLILITICSMTAAGWLYFQYYSRIKCNKNNGEPKKTYDTIPGVKSQDSEEQK